MVSSWSTSATPTFHSLPKTFFLRKQNLLLQNPISFRKPNSSSFVCLTVGIEQIAEITQNKVLVAAVISTAIGQLSKPFTSAIFYRKNIDLKSVVRAGGFPSTHSASVVAAATSLGIERGFSDSIFGSAVIFACLVMYDAQGVRREVGKHAKVLNKKILHKTQNTYMNIDGLIEPKSEISSKNSESFLPLLSISEKGIQEPSAMNSPCYPSEKLSNGSSSNLSGFARDAEPVSNINRNNFASLEESIGHTEVEVIAGAFLGFLVTLAVYSLM